MNARPIGVWVAAAVVAVESAHSSAAVLDAQPGPPRAPNDERSAARFATRSVRLLAENRYAVVWQGLHPAHQRAASRAEYVACESKTPIPGHLESLSAQRVTDERVAVAGVGVTMTKAVAVRLVIADNAVPSGVVVDHIVHVVRTGGAWRWILPSARYAAYRDGRCLR